MVNEAKIKDSETVHMAVLVFGGLIHEVIAFNSYSDAYDCVMQFIDVDEDNEAGISEEDIEFDFRNLYGTKYESTGVHSAVIK